MRESLRSLCEEHIARNPLWSAVSTEPWHESSCQVSSGRWSLRYQLWTSAIGLAKLMTLDGAKVSVETLFLVPSSAHAWPLMAAETVLLGTFMQVAVLDVVGDAPIPRHDWQQILSDYRHLSLGELPDWFADCASGQQLLLRQPDPAVRASFHQAVQRCMDAWLQASNVRIPHSQSRKLAYQIWLEQYMFHHRDHSPGVPLMSRGFGAQFTQDFMRAFFEIASQTPAG